MPLAVEIRACKPEDVDVLEAVIPSQGQTRFHERRFREISSTYLIAWLDGAPIGHLNVRWDGDPDLSRAVGPYPELNALGVWPPALRSHGIGRALIEAGESLARSRGYVRVALGVGIDNERASGLYARLGYENWGRGSYEDRWTWTDDDGAEHEETQVCTWLVKKLE